MEKIAPLVDTLRDEHGVGPVCHNNRRLLERLGHIPPAEAEQAYYASIVNGDLAA